MSSFPWRLLILTLPGDHPTGRMRVWRALKALGCGALRDGVYLLPTRPDTSQALAAQVEAIEAIGGSAWLLDHAAGPEEHGRFVALLDRSADFAALQDEIEQCREQLADLDAATLRRQLKGLRRSLESLLAIDYFPGPASETAQARLTELERQAHARLHPGEPSAGNAGIVLLAKADYQGRLWATRRRPWVDRLASAWLIRRHIDPAARILWLASPDDCPPGALGFDFDGAAFSHVGERVTFETLLASFSLATDPALMRLARIVHYLDVGGAQMPEAAGLETLLAGMKAAIPDDDPLLDAACSSFDYFYSALKEQP
jgi:hypothetical protein